MIPVQAKFIASLLFISFLWMPVVIMIFSERLDVSMAERRELASFPSIRGDTGNLSQFPVGFESWFNDHFGMREMLVRWHNQVRVEWLGISSNEWVLVGDDKWLYQAGEPHLSDMRNNWPYSLPELGHWSQVLDEKNRWLDDQGIKYLFVVTPNKHVIYPEYLPPSINRVNQVSRTGQLVSSIREFTDVPILDLTAAMFAAKQELRAYHKTDTHWNAWGAYRGYRTIIERVRGWYPDIEPLEYTAADFYHVDRVGGDLADGLAMNEILRESDVRLLDKLPRCARNIGIPEDADEGQMYSNIYATECEGGQHRLLILRDSYAVAMIPYLAETFAHVDYFTASPVSIDTMKELVRVYQPDIIIEQRSSRWLRGPEG
jgi:alginate O-acetyltransferase complex protein AlgJ